MANEFDRASLLAEPLGEAEVRELLERLGQAEFGGDERATVGAVIEATGADPVQIARFLAEIRGKALEERFKSAFDDHETRIDRLEERTTTLERTPPVIRRPAPLLNLEQIEIRDRAMRGDMGDDDQLTIIWVAVFVLLCIVVLWANGPT